MNFNPRSREGSDPNDRILRYKITDFNPRSREGSDSESLVLALRFHIISIHAPARGATSTFISSNRILNNFNPRSREGSDGTYSHR